MPKGRHLKPDFFTDKHIVSMTPLARLLYEGLWCYSHDCGHLDDEPIELKMRILPADSCDIESLLGELVTNGRIVRDNGVIFLPKLSDHARIDRRYETLCLSCKEAREPVVNTPSKGSPSTPSTKGSRRANTGDTQGSHRDHDDDGDGDGDGELMVKGSPSTKSPKKRATRLPAAWQPTDEHKKRAADHRIDVDRQAAKFRLHAEEHGRTAANWNAAFTRWLMNAAEWSTQNSRPAAPARPHVSLLEPAPSGMTDEEYDAWEAEQMKKRRGA